jgi:hypothetical protein
MKTMMIVHYSQEVENFLYLDITDNFFESIYSEKQMYIFYHKISITFQISFYSIYSYTSNAYTMYLQLHAIFSEKPFWLLPPSYKSSEAGKHIREEQFITDVSVGEKVMWNITQMFAYFLMLYQASYLFQVEYEIT